VIQFWVRK